MFVAGTSSWSRSRVQARGTASARRRSCARSPRSAGRRGPGRWPRSSRVFTLLFTVFLTNPAGLWDGHPRRASRTGSSSTAPGRGEKEWYFYIVVLFAEEWPALLLGAVGAVATLPAPDAAARCSWSGTSSSRSPSTRWANERFTWLVLHPLLPLLLLAGLGVQAIWDARARWPGELGLALVVALRRLPRLRVLVGERRERRRPARVPRHHAVLRGRSRACATRSRGRRARAGARAATLASSSTPREGATFPWAWYFRDLAGRLPRPDARRRCPSDTDVAILTEAGRDRLRGELARLRGPALPVPRLVGARLRRDVARRLVALVHPPRAVERDRRAAGVALRPPGRLSAAAAQPRTTRACIGGSHLSRAPVRVDRAQRRPVAGQAPACRLPSRPV